MNRRRFLKNLIGATAATAAAFSILPAATTYARKWVKTSTAQIWVPNPEWVTAEYEVMWMGNAEIVKKAIAKSAKPLDLPMRYTIDPVTGGYKLVLPYITQPT